MSVQSILHQIAQSNGVTVNGLTVQEITLCDRICQLLSRLFGYNEYYRQKAEQTCNFFAEVFGDKRFHRAAKQAGIDLDGLKARGDFFTKKRIEQLFVQLAMITTTDLEEAAGKSLNDLGTEEIDALYKRLLPFDSSDDLLCRKNSLNDRTAVVFNKAQMHWQVARSCELMRHKKLSLEEWEVYFAKRLSPPQFAQSLVVRHPEGYLYFSGSIENRGTSKLIFRPLGSATIPTHVLYRGTRGPMPTDTVQETIDTFREDFTKELGAVAAMRSYQATHEAFSKENRIRLIGFSLGGALAQRDCVLFSKLVERVVTVNAPGIDRESAKLFVDTLRLHKKRIEIVHNNDADDFIDTVGECHLGHGCDVAEALITVRTYSKNKDKNRPVLNFWFMIAFIQGIRAHVRATCVQDHVCHVISNANGSSTDLYDLLDHHPRIWDARWEQARSFISGRHNVPFSQFAAETLSKK